MSSKEGTPRRDLDSSIGVVKVSHAENGVEVQEVEVNVLEGAETPLIVRPNKQLSPRVSTGEVARLPLTSLGIFLRI